MINLVFKKHWILHIEMEIDLEFKFRSVTGSTYLMILIEASNAALNETFINASKYGNKIQLEVTFTCDQISYNILVFKTLDFTYGTPTDLEVKSTYVTKSAIN